MEVDHNNLSEFMLLHPDIEFKSHKTESVGLPKKPNERETNVRKICVSMSQVLLTTYFQRKIRRFYTQSNIIFCSPAILALIYVELMGANLIFCSPAILALIYVELMGANLIYFFKVSILYGINLFDLYNMIPRH